MNDNFSVVSANQADPAQQKTKELMALLKSFGIQFKIKDKDFKNICADFSSFDNLLPNPEFVSRFKSDLYICDKNETIWFKIQISNGKIKNIIFVLNFKIKSIKIINKSVDGFDFLWVIYTASNQFPAEHEAIVPAKLYSPSKITTCFIELIGSSSDNIEIGKLLCYIINRAIPLTDTKDLVYIGDYQGWIQKPDGRYVFSSNRNFPDKLMKQLPVGVQRRELPVLNIQPLSDITPDLIPLFGDKLILLVLLLFRESSLFQTFLSEYGINNNQILVIHPTDKISADLLTAILKNTNYQSFNAPSLGPNVKPLKVDTETINDGVLLVRDTFAADQYKKIEKGLDILINDINSSVDSNSKIHHIPVIISSYADLYIPQNMSCVLEVDDVITNYSPIQFRNVLKSVDASIIYNIECNFKNVSSIFSRHIQDMLKNIPEDIPKSKINTYIMLLTTLRTHNEIFSPLFPVTLEKKIKELLCYCEQDMCTVNDMICSEFSKILNQKICDGYFQLVKKDDVTPFDTGTHTMIVDREKNRIYIETAESFSIVKNDMKGVIDTDSLTTALDNEGYLHINVHNSKSHRITTIDSNGDIHRLYSHGIKYSLITPENKQRFELVTKEPYLYGYDELPNENFLPLIKTIDGRFAGKMLIYENEESNHFFGTGRTGSGKSWQIAQILPMLFMLGHNVIVFDVSRTYTKAKLNKMLTDEIVEHQFKFISIGVDEEKIPVNLGSLKNCNNLPDKKRAVFGVLRAAIGSTDKDMEKNLKSVLSEYLKDKSDEIDFKELINYFEEKNNIDARVLELLDSTFNDIDDVGFESQTWGELFEKNNKIIIINLGNEVGDSTHQLLNILVASLFNWQMIHNKQFLTIGIDELKDQDFSKGSPLSTIVGQGRKFHTSLLGATQDYFNQGSSHLDVLKQANIKSFCRPGKGADIVAQILEYKDASDAGFNKFRSGDTIIEGDFYNKELGINESVIIKGRVVNFIETSFCEKFKNEYTSTDSNLSSNNN